jgi:hypothetical protein
VELASPQTVDEEHLDTDHENGQHSGADTGAWAGSQSTGTRTSCSELR